MDQGYTIEDLLSDDTFRDYCENEQSPGGAKWADKINGDPALARTAAEARKFLSLLNPSLSQSEIDEEINKLRKVITDKESRSSHQRKISRRRIVVFSLPALIVLASVIIYFTINSSPKQTIASSFSTKTGERKQYILPDGSTIILNSNSSFTFNKAFGKAHRQVHLKGDAFFKVAKDPSVPFTVVTDGFSTTAIGTAFYVHASGPVAEYSVDLLEGKVKLEKNTSGETLYLTAGHKASWTKQQQTFVHQPYDTVSLNRWVEGILTFNDMPVEQVLEELEKWYAVEIEDRRTNREIIRMNGDYVNAPLEDVLKIICFSLSCNYNFEGNKIIIQ